MYRRLRHSQRKIVEALQVQRRAGARAVRRHLLHSVSCDGVWRASRGIAVFRWWASAGHGSTRHDTGWLTVSTLDGLPAVPGALLRDAIARAMPNEVFQTCARWGSPKPEPRNYVVLAVLDERLSVCCYIILDTSTKVLISHWRTRYHRYYSSY